MFKKTLLASAMMVFASSAVTAQVVAMNPSVELSLQADNGARWYEYYSGAFYELGKQRDVIIRGQKADGAWNAADNAATGVYNTVGGGDVAFPQYGNWANIGKVTYADGVVTGAGKETVAITGLTVEFNKVAGADNVAVLGLPYTTKVDNASGTLTFENGKLANINLNSTLTFTYAAKATFGQNFTSTGSFNIVNNAFNLNIGKEDIAQNGQTAWTWVAQGNAVTEVPVPAAAWLFGSAILGLAGLKRKK